MSEQNSYILTISSIPEKKYKDVSRLTLKYINMSFDLEELPVSFYPSSVSIESLKPLCRRLEKMGVKLKLVDNGTGEPVLYSLTNELDGLKSAAVSASEEKQATISEENAEEETKEKLPTPDELLLVRLKKPDTSPVVKWQLDKKINGLYEALIILSLLLLASLSVSIYSFLKCIEAEKRINEAVETYKDKVYQTGYDQGYNKGLKDSKIQTQKSDNIPVILVPSGAKNLEIKKPETKIETKESKKPTEKTQNPVAKQRVIKGPKNP